MSKKYPECPLYNHNSCKDIDIEDVCAIVRKDKICQRKAKKAARPMDIVSPMPFSEKRVSQ